MAASECPDTLLVVKAGEDGAKVAKQGIQLCMSGPTLGEGECIDSCGAGDCFAAAFLYKFCPKASATLSHPARAAARVATAGHGTHQPMFTTLAILD